MGVVIENYLSWVPINSSTFVLLTIKYIEFLGASFVHIFFFLSGYGLVKKYHDSETFTWKKYAINRFSMIVVPYWIVVIATYFFINILHNQNPEIFGASFNLSDLLSYVFFIRNFNRAAWGMNPTLWFMQIIFGLYIVFPFLFFLMNKYGWKRFLLMSALIAYSSRCVYWVCGYQPERESSIFLFYIFEFSLGMAFGRIPSSEQISIKIGSTNVIYFLVAVLCYSISYILKMKIGIGANLHEVFTCVGSVALGIFCYQAVAHLKFEKFEKTFNSIGNTAFIIYLTHAPPILHFSGPILEKVYNNYRGVLVVCTLLVVYLIFIILISKGLAKHFQALSIKIERSMVKAFGMGISVGI